MEISSSASSISIGMLIRRDRSEVFNAFVNPIETSHFWFTKSSGYLESGKSITWEWEMFGASAEIQVLEIEPDRRILIDWGTPEEPALVEWKFSEILGNGTFVEIRTSEFNGPADEILKNIQDQTGGFALVLAGAKAWLEHGINLNLVADRFPDSLN